MAKRALFFSNSFGLFKETFSEWLEDKAPQLGAALAYYTVFSLAPLVLVLLAIVGLIFRNDPGGAWNKITEQMSYFLDKSAVEVVQNIAQKAAQPNKSMAATIIGILLALFGASGVFGQLQDALNTIWGVKAKPGAGIWGFLRSRFLSFAMVGGVCFLLLVSLTLESVLKGFSHYIQGLLPGGIVIAMAVYWIFDLAVVILLFAIIFKFLPRRKNSVARRLDWSRYDGNIFRHRKMGARSISWQRECRVRLRSSQFFNYTPTMVLLFFADTSIRR
jgi:membrane protein